MFVTKALTLLFAAGAEAAGPGGRTIPTIVKTPPTPEKSKRPEFVTGYEGVDKRIREIKERYPKDTSMPHRERLIRDEITELLRKERSAQVSRLRAFYERGSYAPERPEDYPGNSLQLPPRNIKPENRRPPVTKPQTPTFTSTKTVYFPKRVEFSLTPRKPEPRMLTLQRPRVLQRQNANIETEDEEPMESAPRVSNKNNHEYTLEEMNAFTKLRGQGGSKIALGTYSRVGTSKRFPVTSEEIIEGTPLSPSEHEVAPEEILPSDTSLYPMAGYNRSRLPYLLANESGMHLDVPESPILV